MFLYFRYPNSILQILDKIDISIIDIIKIGIIIFVGLSLIENILPFYQGWDAYTYALSGVEFVKNGTFLYSNEMWEKTGLVVFIPTHWVPTQQEDLIPIASPGILGVSAFSFLVGGYIGLYYVGPILGILLLITSERISTKLFGKYVGFVMLVFLAFHYLFFQVGIQLLTDNIFSIFFLLGCFFLIKFFKNKSERAIFLCSIFLMISAFFRFGGVVFILVEILLVIGYFIYLKRYENLT